MPSERAFRAVSSETPIHFSNETTREARRERLDAEHNSIVRRTAADQNRREGSEFSAQFSGRPSNTDPEDSVRFQNNVPY